MRMADGTYQWFKDKGEVSRRADGTAFRMAGIFINIDAEKRARQYTQRVDAFTVHTQRQISVNTMWIFRKTALIL